MNDITTQQNEAAVIEKVIQIEVGLALKKMLIPLVKQVPSSVLIEELIERDLNPKFTIEDVSTEIIGFNLTTRSDKTDVLVNFSEEELAAELYIRDADLVVRNMRNPQKGALMEALLESGYFDPEVVFRSIGAEALLELVLENVATADILRACADSLG